MIPIKLEKIRNLKFSGKSRDFVSFRNDFNAIIVPHRAPSEIGLRLRQAVPKKYRHLLSNIELHEHVKMMKVLEDKFGTTRQIVLSVVSDLNNLEMAQNDEDFVKFAEKIEEGKRNLEAINLLSEISNETIIAKLESKLPDNVMRLWLDTLFKDDLVNKDSKVKFEHLMKHLTKCKETANYCLTSPSLGDDKIEAKFQFITGKTVVIPSSKKVCGMKHERSQTQEDRKLHVALKSSSGIKEERKMYFAPCLACVNGSRSNANAVKHDMRSCEFWQKLSDEEKKAKVKCVKHPFALDGHETKDCSKKIDKCKKCNLDIHHPIMCPKRIKANEFEDLKKEKDEFEKKVSLLEEENLKKAKAYEWKSKQFEELVENQRMDNDLKEIRENQIIALSTQLQNVNTELKISKKSVQTEAYKLKQVQTELDVVQNLNDEMKKQISTLKGSEMQSEKLEDRSRMHVACSINQDIYKIILIAFVHLLGAVFKNLKQTDSQILPSNIPSLGRPPGKLWKCLGELIQKNSNYKSRLTLPLLQMMIQKNAKESTAGECKKKNEGLVAAMRSVSWCDGQLQYTSSDPTHI